MANTIATSTNADATADQPNPLVFMAPSDASAVCIFQGNNGPLLATAQSPYSTWATQVIGVATTRNLNAICQDSGDNVFTVVQSPTNGPYVFPATRSGNAWTLGSGNNESIGPFTTSNGANAVWIGKDAQGRLWLTGTDQAVAQYQAGTFYTTNGGVTWTTSLTPANLPDSNAHTPAAAIIGNFMVIAYDDNAGNVKYQRLDVSGASLGAWSAAATVTVGGDTTTSSEYCLMPIPGGTTGVLLHTGANGISANIYDSSNDTWGAPTVLSASTSDIHPHLIPGATGTIYAIWCSFQAANNYSLVGKEYSSGAWGSVTTLEPAGNNIAFPHGAYVATGKLALMWTQGTASPYNVQFDLVTFSSLTTNTRTVPATAALLATLTRTVGATTALLSTLTRTVSATVALLATPTRSASETVALLGTPTRPVIATVSFSTTTRNVPLTGTFSLPSAVAPVSLFVIMP